MGDARFPPALKGCQLRFKCHQAVCELFESFSMVFLGTILRCCLANSTSYECQGLLVTEHSATGINVRLMLCRAQLLKAHALSILKPVCEQRGVPEHSANLVFDASIERMLKSVVLMQIRSRYFTSLTKVVVGLIRSS